VPRRRQPRPRAQSPRARGIPSPTTATLCRRPPPPLPPPPNPCKPAPPAACRAGASAGLSKAPAASRSAPPLHPRALPPAAGPAPCLPRHAPMLPWAGRRLARPAPARLGGSASICVLRFAPTQEEGGGGSLFRHSQTSALQLSKQNGDLDAGTRGDEEGAHTNLQQSRAVHDGKHGFGSHHHRVDARQPPPDACHPPPPPKPERAARARRPRQRTPCCLAGKQSKRHRRELFQDETGCKAGAREGREARGAGEPSRRASASAARCRVDVPPGLLAPPASGWQRQARRRGRSRSSSMPA